MQSTTSLKRNYKIRLNTLRSSAKRQGCYCCNQLLKLHYAKQGLFFQKTHRSLSFFTEHCRGRISEEIISVLENTFDLITISSIFSEITSIS